MRIAIVLYERLTVLDAIGPYEILVNLPDSELTFVGERTGEVRSNTGRLGLTVDTTYDEFTNPDIVVVPGGPGQNDHMTDDSPLIQWLRAVDPTTTWTTSVCTGSLILAAAGLLDGRRATSHWLAIDELTRYGATPTSERVVIDGKYVTGAGVSAGIDMALTLAAKIAGDDLAQRIQLGTEYDPQPPFNAGSPAKAPQQIVDAMRASSRFILQGQ
jgi:transcriptional regulator GlxA family with amidase domain